MLMINFQFCMISISKDTILKIVMTLLLLLIDYLILIYKLVEYLSKIQQEDQDKAYKIVHSLFLNEFK